MFKDFIERLENWRTTLLGVATLILMLLLSTGVIGVEAKDFFTQHLNGIWEGLLSVLVSINAIVAIWSKWKKE